MIAQRHVFPLAATLAVSVLAACGGGGATSSSPLPSTPVGVTAPAPTAAPKASAPPAASPSPASTPTPVAPAAAPLATTTLGGAPGFVNAQSRTVYIFDADLAAPGTSTCSGACSGVWPTVGVAAGTALPAPFTAIKRADGSLQLAYAGRPLYTYVADSGAGSIAGNGLVEFGGAWHIARPAGVTAPAPTPSTIASPVGGYP